MYNTFVKNKNDTPPPYENYTPKTKTKINTDKNLLEMADIVKYNENNEKLNMLKAFDIYIYTIAQYENRLLFTSRMFLAISYDEFREKINRLIHKIITNHSNSKIKYIDNNVNVKMDFIKNFNTMNDTRDKLLIVITDRQFTTNERIIFQNIANSPFSEILTIPINVNTSLRNTINIKNSSRMLKIPYDSEIEEWIKDGLRGVCKKKYPDEKENKCPMSFCNIL